MSLRWKGRGTEGVIAGGVPARGVATVGGAARGRRGNGGQAARGRPEQQGTGNGVRKLRLHPLPQT